MILSNFYYQKFEKIIKNVKLNDVLNVEGHYNFFLNNSNNLNDTQFTRMYFLLTLFVCFYFEKKKASIGSYINELFGNNNDKSKNSFLCVKFNCNWDGVYSFFEDLMDKYIKNDGFNTIQKYLLDELGESNFNYILNWVCAISNFNYDIEVKSPHVSNSILLTSNKIQDVNELKQVFFKYCIQLEKSVYQNTIISDSKNKIKVYTISLEDKETISSIENPEYKSWLEKFNEIKEVTEEKSVLAELVKDAPSKIITHKTTKKEVMSKEINEVYKDFKTMYLSQKDKQHLISVLHNYKHKKQLLNDLGFPNKLGVMLYGLPGCGKTSTIITIASYLQKNIYYLNLNGIKTNEDLATIFDHVIKLSANGGIIVMEDIDAMTKVVHKRNYSSESSDDESSKYIYENKSKLTLEFFLNLLQGSLTRDDTIFITTTNHIEVLDPAFYRDGRFDVKIEMKPADKYQITEMFKVFFNREPKEELLYNIEEHKYPCATFLNHFYKYLMDSEQYTDEDILGIFLP